jgi:hypothetical protein
MRGRSARLPAFSRAHSSCVRRHSLDAPLSALVLAMLLERFRPIVAFGILLLLFAFPDATIIPRPKNESRRPPRVRSNADQPAARFFFHSG